MKPKAPIPQNEPAQGVSQLKEYLGADILGKVVEVYEHLRLPLFRKKDIGFNAGYLKFWAEKKVLPESGNKAGRLTFADFIWVKIITQLKDFGVLTEIMAKLRAALYQTVKINGLFNDFKERINKLNASKEDKAVLLKLLEAETLGKNIDTGVTVLELLILTCILRRKSLAIGVLLDGSFLIIDRENESKYSPENLELLYNTPFVQISISQILSSYLKSDIGVQTVPDLQLLTGAENKLYHAIKTGDYETITIRFKDKKIKTLELKKSISTNRKIIDVLSEGEFAEVVVKKHNGDISRIEQNIKINF